MPSDSVLEGNIYGSSDPVLNALIPKLLDGTYTDPDQVWRQVYVPQYLDNFKNQNESREYWGKVARLASKGEPMVAGSLLAGAVGAAFTPEILACMSNPVCRTEASTALLDISMGDALGGSSLAVGGTGAVAASKFQQVEALFIRLAAKYDDVKPSATIIENELVKLTQNITTRNGETIAAGSYVKSVGDDLTVLAPDAKTIIQGPYGKFIDTPSLPAPNLGHATNWSEMSIAEKKAFQHSYSRHASDFDLPPWRESNAEQLKQEFNNAVISIKNNGTYIGEKLKPFNSQSVKVNYYEAIINGKHYYYYERLDGKFISAGLDRGG